MTERITNIATQLRTGASKAEDYSITELTAVHNLIVTQIEPAGNPVKGFRDKATAVKRVNALVGAKLRDVTPTATPAPVAPVAAKATAKATPRDGVARIKLLKTGNPHRVGSKDHGKYAKLSDGMTVAAAVAAGVEKAYIRYAERRGLLTVEATKNAAAS